MAFYYCYYYYYGRSQSVLEVGCSGGAGGLTCLNLQEGHAGGRRGARDCCLGFLVLVSGYVWLIGMALTPPASLPHRTTCRLLFVLLQKPETWRLACQTLVGDGESGGGKVTVQVKPKG